MRALVPVLGGNEAMQAIRKLFAPRAAVEAGRRLFHAAAVQARQPALYLGGGVPDTPEGRFELYSLHLILVMHRLKGQGSEAAEVSQALFEAYRLSLDDTLREMGVGDLSVGKKMRKLFEAFYGRVKSYDAALAGLPDREPLTALITRTALAGAPAGDPAALAAYVVASVDALAAQPLDEVRDAKLAWPAYV